MWVICWFSLLVQKNANNNPKNEDNRYSQYAVIIILFDQELTDHFKGVNNIRLITLNFNIKKYVSKETNFPTDPKIWEIQHNCGFKCSIY